MLNVFVCDSVTFYLDSNVKNFTKLKNKKNIKKTKK